MPENKTTVLGVILEGDILKKFQAIKKEYGLEKNADLVRLLISDKFKDLGFTLPEEPFEQINAGENGVLLHDRILKKTVEVYFKPSGIKCDYHKIDDCEHVQFALNIPEVKKIVEKKRKEGWNLPEV